MTREKKNCPSHGVSSFVVGAAFIATLGGFAMSAHAQDECATATSLTAGVSVPFTFTATFPTPSAGVPVDTQCPDGTLLWTASTPDLWF